MKGRYTDKLERRVAFRNWRRHIGAVKRVQFEESRKKIISRDIGAVPLSSSLESDWPDPMR